MDFFDEAGPSNRSLTNHSLSMDFLDEAGPSSRPQSYDNCIFYNRSDCSNSEHDMDMDTFSEPSGIYADRTKENVSIFPGEEFVYRDSKEVEDEGYLECGKPAKLFESLVGFAAHVEGYLRDDNHCLTKDQLFAEIKVVRRLLINNAEIFDQMTDFILSKHLSSIGPVKSDTATSEDVTSGVFSDENTYDTKPIIDGKVVLSEKINNMENVHTPKYNLRAPKPRYSKYDTKNDKENSDPRRKSERKSNEKRSSPFKKQNKVKSKKSNLKVNPVSDKFSNKLSKKKKIEVKKEVKSKASNLKSNPVAIQKQLVVDLKDILKRLPTKVKKPDPVVKKPNPVVKKNKPPTYKISETNVRTSKRPRSRRTVYLAGERLYLNANGTLSRIDDIEYDTDARNNKRKSEYFKDDDEPVQKNNMNVNLKGSQSLPIIKKRKLYSQDEWMMSLNEKGIGDY